MKAEQTGMSQSIDASSKARCSDMDRTDVERMILECTVVNELLQRASVYLDDLMVAVSDMSDDEVTSSVREACEAIDRAIEQAEAERDEWSGSYASLPDCVPWIGGIKREALLELGASEYRDLPSVGVKSEEGNDSDDGSDYPCDEPKD